MQMNKVSLSYDEEMKCSLSYYQVFGIVSNTEIPMMVLEFLDKGDLKSLLLDSGNSMTCDHLVTICENVS